MADQNLVSFIKTSLKKGSSEEDITKTLLDEGWQNEMISEGFKKIEISRSENINNPVDKIEFLTSLPKTKKIGWKIFFTFILLLLTLYYIYFNLLSVLLIQIYKYINILSTLSSFVWLLTIVTSFFLIYVYTKNILEPNSNFNKFFKTSYIGGLVLIISYFGYIFFGYIFLPEISAYIFALINIIFPVLSIIYALKAIHKNKSMLTMLVSIIIISIIFPIYSYSHSYSIYSKLIGSPFANDEINISDMIFSEQVEAEVTQQNSPEPCKKLKNGFAARCYFDFALTHKELLDADYCKKINFYETTIGAECYGYIGDCEKALEGDEKSAVFCYHERTQKTKNSDSCEKIMTTSIGKNEPWAGARCYIILAQASNNLEYCKKAAEIGGTRFVNDNIYNNTCREIFLQSE
jgi:hypothetical protein